MKLTINVPDNRIADVLEGAASRYWCRRLDWPRYADDAVTKHDSCWHALMADALPFVTVEEDRSEERQHNRLHRVTVTKIAIAFDIMAREYPHIVGEACGSYGLDANTGDVLLQLAALGELRYA